MAINFLVFVYKKGKSEGRERGKVVGCVAQQMRSPLFTEDLLSINICRKSNFTNKLICIKRLDEVSSQPISPSRGECYGS